MKIGIDSIFYYHREDPVPGLLRLKQHGYEVMDYPYLCETETPVFEMASGDFDRMVREDAKIIRDHGLIVNQTHGPWRYPARDATEADRAERFDKMSRALRGTALVGAKYMVIHPIMPFGANSAHEPERFYEINFDFFRRLCQVAKDEGVVICLENMPFPLSPMTTPAQILKFVQEVDSPQLRICLDTGHSIICGVQPADAVRETGSEYLCTLHVHDNDGRNDTHGIPYFGVIDWAEFARALKDIGYSGDMFMECYPKSSMPGNIREHMDIGLSMIARHLADEAEV